MRILMLLFLMVAMLMPSSANAGFFPVGVIVAAVKRVATKDAVIVVDKGNKEAVAYPARSKMWKMSIRTNYEYAKLGLGCPVNPFNANVKSGKVRVFLSLASATVTTEDEGVKLSLADDILSKIYFSSILDLTAEKVAAIKAKRLADKESALAYVKAHIETFKWRDDNGLIVSVIPLHAKAYAELTK